MCISEFMCAELIAAAKLAATKAYCPYSKFPVGSAILTGDGSILSGCNVENASYGLTICAERNAIFQAVAQGKTTVVAVVVFTPTPFPSAPCGACRQVINEFGPDVEIVCVCNGPEVLHTTLAKLLPDAFGPKNLG